MKFAFAAALAIAANASLVTDSPVLKDKLDALYSQAPKNLPQGGTAPTFEQTDAMIYFMMDPTLMYSVPAIPDKNITLNFCMGGLWFLPEYLDHLNFRCKLDGVPVYNENFPILETVFDMWTYCLPFDVPPVAPSMEYFVTITAKSSDKSITNTDLFSIDSTFSLF